MKLTKKRLHKIIHSNTKQTCRKIKNRPKSYYNISSKHKKHFNLKNRTLKH